MFRSQLFWRVYTGYVSIILIFTFIVGILVSRQVAENSLQEIHHSLAVRSELLAEIAKQSLRNPLNTSLQETIVKLGSNTQSRLTVITVSGIVIADSQESPENMDNHLQRPEIIDAASKGFATISRYSQTLQQQMLYRALPVWEDNQVTENKQIIGFVRVSLPLNIIDKKLSQLRLIVVFGAGVAAVAALLIGFYFSKRFTTPLTKMTEAAEAISKGDYDRRISINQQDEIGKLANAFNRMARSSAQRLEEITAERNRLSMIFSGMVEGVIGVDHNQKIIHINQAAAKLLNLSMTHCINKPIWEEVRIPEINNALEHAIKIQGVFKAQMRQPSVTGELVVDIYAAALSNDEGEPLEAVVVLHNISKLGNLARMRRDFVANASHELKTPITAIRGLTETILDDPEMESETRQRFIEKVHTQSLRLSALVTDLMTLSRLESDESETTFQSFDLADVTRQSVSAALSICQEKQLTLTREIVEEEITVTGDEQTMMQLIDNLVDNAIKYTPLGGDILVKLSKDKEHAQLIVKDSGIGISPRYQQRIFERFYRVDKARSRELGGTGLGLSIVKNITEQHGGTVSIESQPGSGSTFIVTLPLA